MGGEISGLVHCAPGTSGSRRFVQGMNDLRTHKRAVGYPTHCDLSSDGCMASVRLYQHSVVCYQTLIAQMFM